jgi:radical SAM superfamily enzyme YgiQ (UPF0313 family)
VRLLFLEVETPGPWTLASMGPAIIGACLRERGHGAALLRVSPAASPGEIAAAAGREAPDLVGVSISTRQWPRAREVIGELRRDLDVPVLAGGLHATFAPETVLAAEGFDWVCIGEGEGAALELLAALERGDLEGSKKIPNIWARGGARPALRPPVEPLDSLPFAARDLLGETGGVAHTCTGRGCPFRCTYCSAGALTDLYAGGYHRRRSPGNVVAELEARRESGPLDYVVFLDDTFTLDRGWLGEFCGVYGDRIGVGFSINGRAETVDGEMLEMLAGSGCRHVIYGVESGSERLRREVMRRPAPNARIREAFRRTRDAGMLATANYMLGLPGETAADVELTLALNDELEPDDFGFFVYYPYPGTALFEVCREGGMLPGNWLELPADDRRSILDLPGFSPSDIDGFCRRFEAARRRLALSRCRPGAGALAAGD